MTYKIIEAWQGEKPKVRTFEGDFLGLKSLIKSTIKNDRPEILKVFKSNNVVFNYYSIK